MKHLLITLLLSLAFTAGAQTLPPDSAPTPYNPASYVDTSGVWHWGDPPITELLIALMAIVGVGVYFSKR